MADTITERFPIVSDELIKALDNLFPDKAPDLSMTENEIWFKAGGVSVVRRLKEIKKRQEATGRLLSPGSSIL